MIKRITFIFFVTIYCLSNTVQASSAVSISQTQPKIIDSKNYKSLGYKIEVQLPRNNEPELKRFYIKFPKHINIDYNYSYSSALYSREGKTLLSYRPEDLSRSDTLGEFYVLANEKVISCLSLVNVYFKEGNYGLHPPSTSIQIDLSSFLDNKSKCNGKQNAANYY